MATANWKVVNVDYTNDDNKGIVSVMYSCHLHEGNVGANHTDKVRFEPNPDSNDFINFDDLTEETVLGWVKNYLNSDSNNEETVSEIEAKLWKKIEKRINPETLSGNPWRKD